MKPITKSHQTSIKCCNIIFLLFIIPFIFFFFIFAQKFVIKISASIFDTRNYRANLSKKIIADPRILFFQLFFHSLLDINISLNKN